MELPNDQTRIWRVKALDNLLTMRAHFHSFSFSNHFHEDFAVGLVEQGVQSFSHRGTQFNIPRGSLFTINPGEVHDGRSGCDHGYRYATIFIPSSLMEEIEGTGHCPCFSSPVNSDATAATLMKKLVSALDETRQDHLELQDCFFSLMTHLLENHSSARPMQSVKDHPAVHRGCTFINDMASHHISLEDMAQAAGMSRFHFLRLFKQQTGLSPGSFLLNRRLNLARQDIDKGVPIGDAAIKNGFFDQSHLNRRFKAAFGLTPRQYQKAGSR